MNNLHFLLFISPFGFAHSRCDDHCEGITKIRSANDKAKCRKMIQNCFFFEYFIAIPLFMRWRDRYRKKNRMYLFFPPVSFSYLYFSIFFRRNNRPKIVVSMHTIYTVSHRLRKHCFSPSTTIKFIEFKTVHITFLRFYFWHNHWNGRKSKFVFRITEKCSSQNKWSWYIFLNSKKKLVAHLWLSTWTMVI